MTISMSLCLEKELLVFVNHRSVGDAFTRTTPTFACAAGIVFFSFRLPIWGSNDVLMGTTLMGSVSLDDENTSTTRGRQLVRSQLIICWLAVSGKLHRIQVIWIFCSLVHNRSPLSCFIL